MRHTYGFDQARRSSPRSCRALHRSTPPSPRPHRKRFFEEKTVGIQFLVPSTPLPRSPRIMASGGTIRSGARVSVPTRPGGFRSPPCSPAPGPRPHRPGIWRRPRRCAGASLPELQRDNHPHERQDCDLDRGEPCAAVPTSRPSSSTARRDPSSTSLLSARIELRRGGSVCRLQ